MDDDITQAAKRLFETEDSDVADRDRCDYNRSFDEMPLGLQQWWRDRAMRSPRMGQRAHRL